MTLAELMVSDATTVCANSTEHATLIRAMDEHGILILDVPVVIDHKTSDIEQVPYGRDDVKRAQLGLPATYEVTDDWQFEIDGLWWAVARDVAASVADDSAGWLWISVITSPINDRGDPKFNARD